MKIGRKKTGTWETRKRGANSGDLPHKNGVEADRSSIEKETLKKGKFIVTTNELDSDKLSDEEAFKAYKEQQ